MAHRIAAALMFLARPGLAQQPAQKQAKNQQEFDLYTAARTEQDPAKKLAAIDEWKAKFPDTELREDRNLFYLSAYLGLAAIGARPDAGAEAAAAGEKYAHIVIDNLDSIFAASIKPSYIKEPEWAAARVQASLRSYGTLAMVAMARRDFAAAERIYTQHWRSPQRIRLWR